MIKTKQAFTLVELIVVIIILSILGTIAFISLQGYSKSSRDSVRISDVSNMKTSLELFHLNSGKYPLPDNNIIVDFDSETLRYQGDFGSNIISLLSRNLSEIPTDPLTDQKYIYSVSNNKNEFEILTLLESDIALNTIPQTNAANIIVTPRIDGNYNGVFIKTLNYIIPTPSIITSEEIGEGLTLTNTNVKSQITTGGKNIPNYGNIIYNTGALTGLKLSVYTGTIDFESSNTDKENLILAIQDAYRGSVLSKDNKILNILSKTTQEELVALTDLLVLNNFNKNVILNTLGTYGLSFDSEENFIQEDSTDGTDFEGGVAKLHINSSFLYPTIDPNKAWDYTLSNGNKTGVISFAAANGGQARAEGIGVNSGKWYWEIKNAEGFKSGIYGVIPINDTTRDKPTWASFNRGNGYVGIFQNGSHSNPGYVNWSEGTTIGLALDMTLKTLSLYVDNTFKGTIDFSSYYDGEFLIPHIGNGYELNGNQTVRFNPAEIQFTPPSGFTKGFGYGASFYPTEGKYVRTSSNNNLSLNNISKISTISISNIQPNNTSIKTLVSFDGGTNWKKWNGSIWVNHTGGLNDLQNGNTISEIELGLTNYSITSEVSLDFAFDLITIDNSITPEISNISIDYE